MSDKSIAVSRIVGAALSVLGAFSLKWQMLCDAIPEPVGSIAFVVSITALVIGSGLLMESLGEEEEA